MSQTSQGIGGAGLVLAPSADCVDADTGLVQKFALRARAGSTVISPLTTLPMHVSSNPSTSSSRLSQGSAQLEGRRLDVDERSQAIANKLDLNQTDYVATLDLSTYDAQLAVKEGRDYCTSGALVVRGMQAQAIIIQTVVVMKALAPDTNFREKAGEIFPVLANAVLGTGGFAKFKTVSGYDDLASLWSANDDEKNAIKTAMMNSYLLLDETMPKCPALSSWQRELLNLHNTKRALHCAQPMNWDHELASSSANFAATCPTSSNSHSAGSINENVVYAATTSTTQVGQMRELFSKWYDEQIETYTDRYLTAVGPCSGGSGVNFTVTPSISAPEGWVCFDGSAPNTRVREFAQLLWAEHTSVGCGAAVCPFGQALVCQYTRKGCEGEACLGNVAGAFQDNVYQNMSSPGPCSTRAWPMINVAAQAAHTSQDYVPGQIDGMMTVRTPAAVAAFLANTSLAALVNTTESAIIPLFRPLPPSPPPAPAGAPAPFSPAGIIPGTFAQTSDAENTALGWVWIFVLIFMLLLLLCFILPCVMYRISGGEPKMWIGLQLSHSNPNMVGYKPAEVREQIAADVGIYQQAMFDAIKSYKHAATGWLHMRRDHLNFIKAGGVESKRTEYGLPYPEKPDSELDSDSALGGQSTSSAALPDAPGIDPDLNAEFTETPDDRNRRLEWIRYYVREKDLPRAYDLGWDGKPFRQASFLPADRPASVSSGASAVGSSAVGDAPATATETAGKALHRI